MLKPVRIPPPVCFKCGAPAQYQQRMAIAEKGAKTVSLYLFTGDHACHKCRSQEGIRAKELLTEEAMNVARAAMPGKEPDFDRAFLEWMAIP